MTYLLAAFLLLIKRLSRGNFTSATPILWLGTGRMAYRVRPLRAWHRLSVLGVNADPLGKVNTNFCAIKVKLPIINNVSHYTKWQGNPVISKP